MQQRTAWAAQHARRGPVRAPPRCAALDARALTAHDDGQLAAAAALVAAALALAAAEAVAVALHVSAALHPP